MPAITLNFNDVTKTRLKEIYEKVNKHFNEDIIDLEKLPHISLMRVKEDFEEDLVKLIDFQDIHQKVWKDIANNVDLFEEKYYSPEHFSQHITIHLNDQSKENVLRVLNYLLDCNIHFLAIADKLAFIHTDEDSGECKIYVEKQLDNLVSRFEKNSNYLMEMYKKHLHKIGDRVTIFEDEEKKIDAVTGRNGISHENMLKLTVPGIVNNDE